jgi:hypothetical protein
LKNKQLFTGAGKAGIKSCLTIFLCLALLKSISQETNIVILAPEEVKNFREIIKTESAAKSMADSILDAAKSVLNQPPRPLEIIYYEGLLDTDPKRINTVESFQDIDNIVTLIYAGYGSDNPKFGEKAREIIVSWSKKYKPTGNPINENKFTAFFWAYHLYRNHFSKKEQEIIENWMQKIALAEKNRKKTPNNNWEAKRLKIIGIIGCILQDESLNKYAVEGFKKYIASAYFPDETSNDLRDRDALHYHVSGLKPCLTAFINLSAFDSAFNLYDYETKGGASIKKSVEYVVPYATGEKQRKEWMNSKVELDKKRAAAGIEKYQPGKLFDPKQAWEMFEWACYYNTDWFSVFEISTQPKYTFTWIGFLNSPLIRNNANKD